MARKRSSSHIIRILSGCQKPNQSYLTDVSSAVASANVADFNRRWPMLADEFDIIQEFD